MKGYRKLQSKDIDSTDHLLANKDDDAAKKSLNIRELLRVLSPYFWPDEGSDGALINRIRSTSTWLLVSASKACSLIAPLYLAAATNELADGEVSAATSSIIIYCVLRFLSSFFKELQSIVYIKVKQQASIELQELVFAHLHSLSLHWHITKKTGSVMKSMDRGVDAVNQLVSYLFLFLVPAILECLAVVILFLSKFRQWQLGLFVFSGVLLYSLMTIIIAQWRKKFREQSNKHDNDYHDQANDSIINFETVKYFTNEQYEIKTFKDMVIKYQQLSSSTQLSAAFLNISQQFILNGTMIGTMIIAGYAVAHGEMSIGNWIAVQTWVSTIFVPLNFLGSIYSAILQAFIDIQNLSELLAQQPDIKDPPGALPIPLIQPSNYSGYGNSSGNLDDEGDADIEQGIALQPLNRITPSIVNKLGGHPVTNGVRIEFRDVCFHYPEQPSERGLQKISFVVPAGTTTAIVGHTGSGKTTISRLLYRFYEPTAGSIYFNEFDITKFAQQSIRKCIGIVPQDTVLFNNTILHNISYGNLTATKEEIEYIAECSKIRTFIETLPDTWKTVVGERGLKLSGGEKQRIAIARCLLKNPPIVLLDEVIIVL